MKFVQAFLARHKTVRRAKREAHEAGKRVNFLVRACATRVVLCAAIDDYNHKAHTVRQLLGKKLYG